MNRGDRLTVVDPQGEQVSDLVAFNAADTREWISSGRTIDYLNRLLLTAGDVIYSNRSSEMLTIQDDDVRRHDFLLAPCSKEMFRKTYGDTNPVPGCFGNLASALAPYGIAADAIPVAFNVFMHVDVDGVTGEVRVLPPKSRAGDKIVFRAEMDLIVGLTACSALQSNNGSFKPIHYDVQASA